MGKSYDHVKKRLLTLEENNVLLFEVNPVAGDKLHVGFVDVIPRRRTVAGDEGGDIGIDLMAEANMGDSRFARFTYLWMWYPVTEEGGKNQFPYLAKAIDKAIEEQATVDLLSQEIINPKIYAMSGKEYQARVVIRETSTANARDLELIPNLGEMRYERTLKRRGANGTYMITKDGFSVFRRLNLLGYPSMDSKVEHRYVESPNESVTPGKVIFNGQVVDLSTGETGVDFGEGASEAPDISADVPKQETEPAV
jgi:hypothetical protein